MWYEIVPCAAIIYVAITVPFYANYAMNRIFNGKPYRRTLATDEDCRLFMRDQRLTGNGHKTVGLEAIPDRTD